MVTTPKSTRLQLVFVGRSNSGKSSLLNLICGSNAAITSSVPGTTTDVVEKAMEFRPFGPVLLLDTAGIDDLSELGTKRIERTQNTIKRADVLIIVCRAGQWSSFEDELLSAAEKNKIPAMAFFTHTDLFETTGDFSKCPSTSGCTLPEKSDRDTTLDSIRKVLDSLLKDKMQQEIPLLRDLVSPGETVIMMVPIDNQAPKGRLILPQVQAIRDVLDANASVIAANEHNFSTILDSLKTPPALAGCDSQVVHQMVKVLPPEIKCTTFSILFARQKGDLDLLFSGASTIDDLQDGDRILIAEACSHHAADDDIGRVKIPRLIEKKCGKKLIFDIISRDFPDNLNDYKLIIHCGSCMLNRRETLSRLEFAQKSGIPITNYGMAISHCQGVLKRVMSPFLS